MKIDNILFVGLTIILFFAGLSIGISIGEAKIRDEAVNNGLAEFRLKDKSTKVADYHWLTNKAEIPK